MTHLKSFLALSCCIALLPQLACAQSQMTPPVSVPIGQMQDTTMPTPPQGWPEPQPNTVDTITGGIGTGASPSGNGNLGASTSGNGNLIGGTPIGNGNVVSGAGGASGTPASSE